MTVLLAASIALVVPVTAHAGGNYITDRGARPLGRGFAMVAGTRDAGALWYNPAALADANRQFFFDTTVTFMGALYQRVDGGGNELPTVAYEGAPLPIPMIAYVDDMGHGAEGWNFALGLVTPNLLAHAWPESLPDGSPAPQRYALVTTEGSILTNVTAGASYRAEPGLSIGASLALIVGNFQSQSVLSSCDGVICSFPESPEYDALTEVSISGLIGIAASVGLTYEKGPTRFGVALVPPGFLSDLVVPGTVRVRLPSAAIFDNAYLDGSSAHVSVPLPWQVRLGLEVKPVPRLAVEADVVLEGWSFQDAIRIEPDNVWIRDVAALDDYQVGPATFPRDANNVWSLRLGGTYTGLLRDTLEVSAGVNYENSAFDNAHLTPLTLDSDKLIVAAGASYKITPEISVDASYGHIFLADRNVTNSRVPQPISIRPPLSEAETVYIGNGRYAMEADIVGLGLRWSL